MTRRAQTIRRVKHYRAVMAEVEQKQKARKFALWLNAMMDEANEMNDYIDGWLKRMAAV